MTLFEIDENGGDEFALFGINLMSFLLFLSNTTHTQASLRSFWKHLSLSFYLSTVASKDKLLWSQNKVLEF